MRRLREPILAPWTKASLLLVITAAVVSCFSLPAGFAVLVCAGLAVWMDGGFTPPAPPPPTRPSVRPVTRARRCHR